MAINNISTAQEIHQKPSIDADQNIFRLEQKRSKDQQIQKMTSGHLISFIDDVVDEIKEKAAHIQCIAFGGRAHTEQTDEDISAGMFGAIIQMSESTKNYLLIKDAITEMKYRAPSSTPVDAIAKPAPAKSGQPNTMQGANDAVWVARVGMSCIKDHISPILAAIEAMSHVDGMNAKAITKRMNEIQKLAQVGVRTAGEMEDTLDCERESMQEKLSELEAVV